MKHKSGGVNGLHGLIGDYMREIEKIERSKSNITQKKKFEKIVVWRQKIREVVLTLQKARW